MAVQDLYVLSGYWAPDYAFGDEGVYPISELQGVAPSAIIELFELDLNQLQHGITETYRFHAGSSLNANGELVWAGNSYMRFPVEADGFEYSGNGQLPRPKIRCSNILGTITALLLSLPSGLEGAKFTRIRTLARYLDAVNFPGSVNPYGVPDPSAEFPREIFYVDRKVVETRDVVEFELAASFDLAGVRAPKRQCISNVCQWVYRSAECGYTGPPIADNGDEALPTLTTSAEAIAYSNAEVAYQATVGPLASTRSTLNTATNALNTAQGNWYLAEVRYDASNKVEVRPSGTFAYWGGAIVSLGTVYRRGVLRQNLNTSYITAVYDIQRWDFDNSAVTTAQANYNAALAAYNSALSTHDAALATRDAALLAWQTSVPFASDIVASGDSCGKRLSSCRLRFGDTAELPFGSFPGIGAFFG